MRGAYVNSGVLCYGAWSNQRHLFWLRDNQRGDEIDARQHPGRPRLLSQDDEHILVDCVRRADRGHSGKISPDIIDMCNQLRPDLSRVQCAQSWHRTTHLSHKDELKAKWN